MLLVSIFKPTGIGSGFIFLAISYVIAYGVVTGIVGGLIYYILTIL
jgi:hypothetical protein